MKKINTSLLITILTLSNISKANNNCPITELVCNKKTIVNCVKCDQPDQAKCLTCVSGTSPSTDKTECLPCPDNCRDCPTNNKECTRCKRGYFLNAKKCEACASECEHCKGTDYCLNCNSGFYRSNTDGKCYKCNVACKSCVSEGVCSSCNSGYFSDATEGLGCIKCKTEEGCLECKDLTTCLICDIKYYLKAGVCVKNPEFKTWSGIFRGFGALVVLGFILLKN